MTCTQYWGGSDYSDVFVSCLPQFIWVMKAACWDADAWFIFPYEHSMWLRNRQYLPNARSFVFLRTPWIWETQADFIAISARQDQESSQLQSARGSQVNATICIPICLQQPSKRYNTKFLVKYGRGNSNLAISKTALLNLEMVTPPKIIQNQVS